MICRQACTKQSCTTPLLPSWKFRSLTRCLGNRKDMSEFFSNLSYLCLLANPASSSFIWNELTLWVCSDPFAPFVLDLCLAFLGHLSQSIIPHHRISERQVFRMCALEEQSPDNLSNKKTIRDHSESWTKFSSECLENLKSAAPRQISFLVQFPWSSAWARNHRRLLLHVSLTIFA